MTREEIVDRKFLYVIAVLIVLVLGAGIAYQLFGTDLFRRVFVPSVAFKAEPPQAQGAYADPAMWYSRPGKGPNDPALWVPAGYKPNPNPPAALFFIHPTSFLDRNAWNMDLDNADANQRARLFIRGQASAWNDVAEVWAPKYRQATFGAFLTNKADAQKALDLAYRDVLAAFDAFVAQVPKDRPIFLAGHSQGALHLERLLRERIAGKPIAKRVVAAYVVGWPISRTADLPALGLPACSAAGQSGCILSWLTFGEPANPDLVLNSYQGSSGLTGAKRKREDLLCVNPLTGTPDSAAPPQANPGTLVPTQDLKSATLEPGLVGARCDKGLLIVSGDIPPLGPFVLPGNNYHVYDYALFWGAIREDAQRRLAAWHR